MQFCSLPLPLEYFQYGIGWILGCGTCGYYTHFHANICVFMCVQMCLCTCTWCEDLKLKLEVFLSHRPPYSLRQNFNWTQRAPIQLVSLAILRLGSPVFFKMLELQVGHYGHMALNPITTAHITINVPFYCNYLVACSRSFNICVVIIAAPLSIRTLGLRKDFLTSEAHNWILKKKIKVYFKLISETIASVLTDLLAYWVCFWNCYIYNLLRGISF